MSSKNALDKLADHLARRDHSEAELRSKLARHYSPDEIDAAISEAQERRWLLPAEELAAKVAEEWHRKGKGILFINQYLKNKGLPPVSTDSDKEKQKAKLVAQQKFARLGDLPYDEKQKVGQYLQNRGFDGETIRNVIYEE